MTRLYARKIRALVFDVFGTVVDWRGSLVREGMALSAAKGMSVDWPALADAWRAGYPVAMQRVRSGDLPWTSVDQLHRIILDTLIPRFGLGALTEPERAALNRVWHRLDPWPDAVAGLQRLKHGFVISTLSNGNMALLVAMAKRAGLPWDCVLSAELMRHYKPDPEVYQGAARLLDVAGDELLMVASHPSDLRGAARAGLRTALVKRPLEYGPNPDGRPPPDALDDDRFDLVADDILDLADRLGC
ncbi:MAG: haloacid dehalogenase type II [Pseudomonadota bacterium]|nr:haloacid dehalogenase type II [Pseudomonadota bacterium]